MESPRSSFALVVLARFGSHARSEEKASVEILPNPLRSRLDGHRAM